MGEILSTLNSNTFNLNRVDIAYRLHTCVTMFTVNYCLWLGVLKKDDRYNNSIYSKIYK